MRYRQQTLNLLDQALTKLAEVQPKNSTSTTRLKEGKEKVRAARAKVVEEPEELLPPPPNTSILWGARVYGDVYGKGDPPWDFESWDIYESHIGKKVSIMAYGNPFGQLQSGQPLEHCVSRNAIPLITVMTENTTIQKIANGEASAQIEQMGGVLASFNRRVVLRFAHEMNGSWYNYGYTKVEPSVYIRAFRNVANGIKVKAPKVEMCWCPNIIGGNVPDPSPWWPGSEFVDIVGVDGYNFGGTSPINVFKPTVERLRAIASSKPIWICETGCVEEQNKPQWITTFLTETLPKELDIDALVYFNGDPVENGAKRTWPIESSSSAQSAFKSGIASSYYQSG